MRPLRIAVAHAKNAPAPPSPLTTTIPAIYKLVGFFPIGTIPLGCYNLVFGPLRILILWKFITPLRRYHIKSSQTYMLTTHTFLPHKHSHTHTHSLTQKSVRQIFESVFTTAKHTSFQSWHFFSHTLELKSVPSLFQTLNNSSENDFITFSGNPAEGRKLISQNVCLWFRFFLRSAFSCSWFCCCLPF